MQRLYQETINRFNLARKLSGGSSPDPLDQDELLTIETGRTK
jgi:hypothetical protein